MPPRTSNEAEPAETPAALRPALRVAVLADSDTRWKWGALTARRLTSGADGPDTRPVEVSGLLLRGRATPTPRQLAEVGEVGIDIERVREVTAVEFLHTVRDEGYDLVVLALVGGGVQAMLHGLAALDLPRRPVVVTGYVGVVYEKLADGLLLRHGADVVLANSAHDAERFRAVYEGVGADASAVTEAALPFLGGAPYRGEEGRDTVVFAAQPSVPASRADRTYLLRRLVEHARLHPRREVLLKLRSKPGEHTTHIEELPYQKLAQRLPGGLPPNFRLVYGHMGEVLDRTDLLVTVSSTAALESLHRRIPTAVLTDLGVRETLGNHHFVGSGLLTSWDRLDGGIRPRPDGRWLAGQGVAADGSYGTAYDTARAKVTALLGTGQLPPLAPYYTPATAPGYLPGILGRHHLAPDGTPLPGAAAPQEPGRVRGAVRETVRNAARGAYRQGVQRVAPVIRRMGEL
ncbi:hypothetical protein OH797_13775 [Streptomyces anulatus]|uniref:DUF6716 putative glycosyltransferase n=1 Tax=Streptomyces TaxID=1883 RepID=UPI0006F33799|nr:MULTISPECIES: DUF6716 putative glycosyltransferase [unclassified Streptomyces]MDF9806162.1 hypothetical protein [Streptomyces sp. HB372]WTC63581.1 hypothetical protein OG865_14020 [Streptomyces anulatus]KQX36324.1 hypothetical protein ASD29_03395 [Streptomyces sp. Root1295]KRA36867.1 hypothetical protein ASD97_22130 [Streptomyces sp. Root63]OKI82578.1 hypothetical protein AMK12_04645 [Streptomyces sp. TSRI0395]